MHKYIVVPNQSRTIYYVCRSNENAHEDINENRKNNVRLNIVLHSKLDIRLLVFIHLSTIRNVNSYKAIKEK